MARITGALVVLSILTAALVASPLVRGGEGPAPKTPTALDAAREKRSAALGAAEKRYRKARIAAQRAFVAELDAALKGAMEAYDLEGANAIDRAKKEAERELVELRSPARAVPIRPTEIVGTWTVRHRDWYGDLVLYEDGRIGRPEWGERHLDEGTWTYERGTLILNWKGWGAESFRVRSCFASKIATMVRTDAGKAGQKVPVDGPRPPKFPRRK